MVKFSYYLLEAAQRVGINVDEYFNYKAVKKAHIKAIINAKNTDGQAPIEMTYDFAEVLASQTSRIQNFSLQMAAELDKKLYTLIEEEKNSGGKRKDHFLAAAHKVGEEFVRLKSYVAVNRLALDKIVKKHDKHAPLTFKQVFPKFFDTRKLIDITFFDAQILALSDFYAKLRGENVDKNIAIGTNFERQSIKYWVHPEDMMTVIMIIVQNLPVYSFKPEDDSSFKRKCISDIKSTYYDNEQLYMYHTRISREEGASLIRIRWYDDKDETLFVERKIHHEGWIEDGSTKERFVLPSKKIDAFIAGNYKSDDFVKSLLTNPRLKPSDVEYQKGLFEEVQARYRKHDLFPSVRTHYPRMAFQIPGDARIRISLDLEIRMMSEWHCPPGHWRSEKPEEEFIYTFPYGIMEVKLQGPLDTMPSWIKELMNSKFCEQVNKFSKFGHGTAILHMDRCNVKPYWFDQMENRIESIYKPDEGSATLYREFRPPAQASKTPRSVARPMQIPGGLPPTATPTEEIRQDSSDDEAGPGIKTGVRQRKFTAKQMPWWARDSEEKDAVDHSLKGLPMIHPRVRVEPKTYFANERTLLHWLSISSLTGMMSLALIRTPAHRANVLVLIVGVVGYAVALLFMIYALATFFERGRLITNGENIKFDNRGPLVLTSMLVVVVGLGALLQSGIMQA